MGKYKVIIEETIAEEFEIEACCEKEALTSAIEKYKRADLVLSNCEVQHKQISVAEKDGSFIEWVSFQ